MDYLIWSPQFSRIPLFPSISTRISKKHPRSSSTVYTTDTQQASRSDWTNSPPAFAHLVFQTDTVSFWLNIYQGVPASTVPIVKLFLETPNPERGQVAPNPTPVVPGYQYTFTLQNIQDADVGVYYVTVEFDIGSLPPPALRYYRSNTFTIEAVVPLPPVWDETTVYALNAVVQYGGNVYQSAIAGNVMNTPSLTSEVWTFLGPT